MKKSILFSCFIFLTYISCRKENSPFTYTDLPDKQTAKSSALSECDLFVYSDTIFYPAELRSDYVVRPLNTLNGSFGAYPDGLAINKHTGKIDISESETGLRYLIWYVPIGTTDTCKKFITISGINYTDSIYTLTTATDAVPMYNATPLQPTDCSGDCEFDDGRDDDDGDGFADEPPAGQEVIPQGIALDKSTGRINLKQSILNGALGTNPAPGTFKNFKLNYRIDDGSRKALNKIAFRLYYFQNQSQIPQKLKNELVQKQSLVILNDNNTTAKNIRINNNSATAKNGRGEVKCRPPYIIIVQQ